AGVPLGNQTVLLRGVNDDTEVMRALVRGLLRMRVRPYYIFHCQLLAGTAHLRTTIEKGLEIMQALRGHTTGFGVPNYVLDTPYGKVPLLPQYLLGRSGDEVLVRTWNGAIWREPNPLHGDAPATPLPEVPADAYPGAATPRRPFPVAAGVPAPAPEPAPAAVAAG
ncbi:MAG: hypothetical protein OXJ62_12965, partial [Spirochaetaceae bacterium]|nr:hypothetical protein [Spirochaetaceae bacterium]